MEDQIFRIEDIYVPVKRRRTLDPATVNTIAESILEEGQRMPIMVRRDGERTPVASNHHNQSTSIAP